MMHDARTSLSMPCNCIPGFACAILVSALSTTLRRSTAHAFTTFCLGARVLGARRSSVTMQPNIRVFISIASTSPVYPGACRAVLHGRAPIIRFSVGLESFNHLDRQPPKPAPFFRLGVPASGQKKCFASGRGSGRCASDHHHGNFAVEAVRAH